MPTINPNQLQPVPLRGQLDDQVNDGGVFNGVIAQGSSDTFHPGDRVKLDSTYTGKGLVFVLCGIDDREFGVVTYIGQKSAFVAGDRVHVASQFRGPVIYMTSTGVITPGGEVEDVNDGTIQAQNTKPVLGLALEYFAAGENARIVLSTGAAH